MENLPFFSLVFLRKRRRWAVFQKTRFRPWIHQPSEPFGLTLATETTFHSKESNTISSKTIVSQNWCILSKDDEYVEFLIFSEVYDGSIFATSELKTELPELR